MKKEKIIQSEEKSISKILVVPMSENEMDYALEIGAKLREQDINTEVFLEDKKLKAKFKYADKLHIPYVIVIGEEEKNNNTITLKNMETGEQKTITIQEAINEIS